MAFTLLAAQPITKDGIVASYVQATASDGDMYRNTGKEFYHVINAGGSPCVVTIATPATISGLTIEDQVVTVAAGTDQFMGPFDTNLFNQPTGAANAGRVQIAYDQVVTVTVAVLRA